MSSSGEIKPLPKSVRYLNYAKATGAILSGIVAVSAFIIANWFPNEDIAKASHKTTETAVGEISSDVQRIFDIQKLQNERIDGLHDQMKLMLATVHAHMSAQPEHRAAPVVRPRRRPASTPLSGGSVPEKPMPEPPKEEPTKLLQAALVQSQEQDLRQEQNAPRLKAAMKRPAKHKLPTLQKLQEQVQQQEE